MGIELKELFIPSKEGEPSFSYEASPTVCFSQDLLAVYPLRPDEAMPGTPKLLRPRIEGDRCVFSVDTLPR
jgi:hypothetical protein